MTHTKAELKVGKPYTYRNREYIPLLAIEKSFTGDPTFSTVANLTPLAEHATEEDHANAAFLVNAWNNHEKLLAALKMAKEWFEHTHNNNQECTSHFDIGMIETAIREAEPAPAPTTTTVHPLFQHLLKNFGME